MVVFPLLHTPRLKLRKLQVEDLPSLVKYANNKLISDRILNIPHPYQEPDAVFRLSYVVKGFKDKSRFVFAIVRKDSEELIGEVSLHLDANSLGAQLGYWVGEPFWGQGFASEAIGAVLDFGFERLDRQLIYATVDEDNPASARVLEKQGMVNNGVRGRVVQFLLSKQDHDDRKGDAASARPDEG